MVNSADLGTFYNFRADLIKSLRTDLLGPVAEQEMITDPPITRYATGIIYPGDHHAIGGDHDLDEADGYDEAAAPDPGIALAHVRYPSSMGITFAVDSLATTSIHVDVSAAMYEPVEPESEDDHAAERWIRRPLDIPAITIEVSAPHDDHLDLGNGLELFSRVRPADEQGAVPVTLALVNRRKAKAWMRDPDAFFQPSITVTSPDSTDAFVPRAPGGGVLSDEELDSYRLLYRHIGTFAIGHGCSADWLPRGASDRAMQIMSTYIPEYELPLAVSNPRITYPALSMKHIVEQPRDVTVADFSRFAADYARWIGALGAEASALPVDLRPAAFRNIEECRTAHERITAGIALLSDDEVWEAFRLANAAMLTQRARSDWIKLGRPTGGPQESTDHRWYPFQLAFILMCLESIANRDSDDRQVADLLWFPTGGGKTEAYLGLIAFTILLRRLRNPEAGGGVTALMRYTLRLLTLQQFERAGVLICALEQLRRSHPSLGTEPISIGLWVGRGATPLTRAETKTALNKLRSGTELSEGNPVQLHTCPWCGVRLDHENYWLPAEKTRLIVCCKNEECAFGDWKSPLPVYVIDDDIYDFRPTLVVATADKYASLPWRHRAGALFNLDHPEPPPELIVQDELHLISGPLGTLTGLYETAVDHLCAFRGTRPKVIASTATIRRAGKQGEGLFARRVAQFPPSGIDARDSFYAVEAPPAEKGTRSYVGVMAPGTSHTSLMVRSYAALLQTAAELDGPDDVRDGFWTLVGYFNSLRVLGGARMQVQDDVGDRIELLATENGSDPRPVDQRIELTSRESSSNIPTYLRQMAVKYPDEDAIDVILATNMISVGVDIGRLGLMAVMGQPPSTSEYIQATSRVGRQAPGLVAVIYNATRSRDRSHYEAFTSYHASLYRQVESTSVTPFASRARDRALHAIVVALARHLLPEFRSNDAASAILTKRDLLEPIRGIILERVRAVEREEYDATAAEIDAFLDRWKTRAQQEPNLVYSNPRHPEIALLGDASRDRAGPHEPIGTLWSLRDVDQASNLYLVS